MEEEEEQLVKGKRCEKRGGKTGRRERCQVNEGEKGEEKETEEIEEEEHLVKGKEI